MSYFKDRQAAESGFSHSTVDSCFTCGKKIEGPNVRHDGYEPGGRSVSIYLHRDCAFVMAQRLIVDTWPNRRDGEHMSVVARPGS